MKKFVAALLLAATACAAIQTPSRIARTKESIALVTYTEKNDAGEDETSYCTGFAVGIVWVITAAHCVSEKPSTEIFVDGVARKVVRKSGAFALLEVPEGTYPVLQVRKGQLEVGDPITAIGFLYGFPISSLRRNVAQYCGKECKFAEEPHLITDSPIGGGMSGGPVIDSDGKVVGMVQAGTGILGIACTGDEIREFLK